MSDHRTDSPTKVVAYCLAVLMIAGSFGCGDPEVDRAGRGDTAATQFTGAEHQGNQPPRPSGDQPEVGSSGAEAATRVAETMPEMIDDEPLSSRSSSDQGETLATTVGPLVSEVDSVAGNSPNVSSPDAESDTATDSTSGSGSLDDRLAAVEIPPRWLADVQTTYDTSNPWKDARLEIRRLLSLGQSESHREAIKLTWLYLQKDDINDGHEYPMYTFLGGEPLWSIRAHQWYLDQPHENTPIHAFITLASLYAQYGEFERAKLLLDQAMQGLPERPWRIMREADLAAAYGDLYAAWSRPNEAKQYYARAAILYPTAKPPYGGHLLPRRAAKVQAKLDLLTFRSLSTAELRDGQYRDKALGYAGDINVTVTVASGKIADIELTHEEKIDQNACVVIPQRIVDQQSLQVDGVSGATVTEEAIINGVFRCLKKAGLQ